MGRPFDWRCDVPGDFGGRRFPAIVGKGRGRKLEPELVEEARRKLQSKRLTPEKETT
jgi:hypothetical protein